MKHLQVSPWFRNHQWAYSITFDEALSELHHQAIPILDKYHVPGHLEVVVGQIGQPRKLFESSYNGFRHMNANELKDMLQRGWGVGNHSWSHSLINLANMDRELDDAKKKLEELLGQKITTYCAPGSNANMSDEILMGCKSYGYLSAMGIYEALNRPDDPDLLWLNRVYLHDNGPITHDAEFDPYRKIQHAIQDQGWIIDYCHCPLDKVVHPRKDCSAEQLEQRLLSVTQQKSVWLATVEDINDYRYLRRYIKQESLHNDAIKVTTPDLPNGIKNFTLTFQLPDSIKGIDVNGSPIKLYKNNNQKLVDLDISTTIILKIIK